MEPTNVNQAGANNSRALDYVEQSFAAKKEEVNSTLEGLYADGEPSELDLISMQRLMQEQNQIMSAITGLMRSMHDMAMSVIRNFRVN